MSITRTELGSEHAAAVAYQSGFADGLAASRRKQSLTPYLRVGLDAYAKGYRSGFFSMMGRQTIAAAKSRVMPSSSRSPTSGR